MTEREYSIMSRSDNESESPGPIANVETRFTYNGYEISLCTDWGGCPEQVDVYRDNELCLCCNTVADAINWINS